MPVASALLGVGTCSFEQRRSYANQQEHHHGLVKAHVPNGDSFHHSPWQPHAKRVGGPHDQSYYSAGKPKPISPDTNKVFHDQSPFFCGGGRNASSGDKPGRPRTLQLKSVICQGVAVLFNFRAATMIAAKRREYLRCSSMSPTAETGRTECSKLVASGVTEI